MKTLLKIVAGIVVVLVVLVGAAAILLPRFIDSDDIKAQAIAKVKTATGRDLRIPGDISLSVFPWLGLDAGEVALGNAPGFAGDTFARMERLSVRLQLMPLLSREVVMDTVVLHGLQVNLARDERGNGNWEDLSGRDGGTAAGDSRAGGSGGSGTAEMAGVVIGGLDIRDAALTFDDAQAGARYALADLDVETGAVELGKPISLKASFDLSGGKPAMQGRVEIAATLSADADAQRYALDGLTVKTDIAGDGLPGGKLAASLGADISADLKAQTVAVSALVIEALGIKTSGELKIDKLMGAEPAFSGNLAVAPFNPRELMTALGVTPPVTADDKVLGSAEARLTLSGTPKAVKVGSLEAKLDDTTLKGSLAVVDVARQALRFDLAGDAIDLDRYLPPPAADTGGEGGSGEAVSASGSGEASAGAGLPMDTLRALDIDGKLAFGSLKVMKLTVTDIALPITAKDGVISLAPIAAKLYQGTYAGNIGVDARGEQAKISLDHKLAGVQAGPLLDDFQGGEGALEGTANTSAKLTMEGADAQRIKQTLNGQLAFAFTDGALRGINIAQMIRGGLAKLKGGSVDADAPRKTDFAELKGTANIKNGLVSNDDLSMKSPLLRVEGKGNANLPADTVDYRVMTTIVGTSQGQGGKELMQLTGVPVPIQVKGSLSDPSIGPDMEALAVALAKGAAGDMIEDGKAKAVEAVTESVGGSLGGALGNALGGGSSSEAAGGSESSGGGSEEAVGDTVNKLKGLFN